MKRMLMQYQSRCRANARFKSHPIPTVPTHHPSLSRPTHTPSAQGKALPANQARGKLRIKRKALLITMRSHQAMLRLGTHDQASELAWAEGGREVVSRGRGCGGVDKRTESEIKCCTSNSSADKWWKRMTPVIMADLNEQLVCNLA